MEIAGSISTLKHRLRLLLEVRNSLATCVSLESIVQQGVTLALEKLNSQTASIFLLSKRGTLKRAKIVGRGVQGEKIDDSWFSDEEYRIGESFTGAAVVPRPNSLFGEPQWSNNLEQTKLDSKSQDIYKGKLGQLRCAIAVPLNGSHRTFGVLEVTNKAKPEENQSFSQNNVYWLSIIGNSIADSISHFRRTQELKVLSDIGQRLLTAFTENREVSEGCSEIARRLIDDLPYYRACVIRLGTSEDTLVPVAKYGSDISWDNWVDAPIKRSEAPSGEVFRSGSHKIIEDLSVSEERFLNKHWMVANEFKSYACFPLSARTKTIGTISLFLGFTYRFSTRDRDFIANIASLTFTYVESIRLVEENTALHLEIENENRHDRDVARLIGYDSAMHERLHSQKNDFQNLIGTLTPILQGTVGVREQQRLLREQIEWLTQRIEEITTEFEETSYSSVDVNSVLQGVVQNLSRQLAGRSINYILELDSDVPRILANEAEIREVFFNLISNAIKATTESDRQDGCVGIETRLEVVDRIEYISISIEDNGIGIPAENSDKIYSRNFSTYAGGTGMGLFITRQILDRYGGKILFSSTVGKGTTFTVRLPRKRLEV